MSLNARSENYVGKLLDSQFKVAHKNLQLMTDKINNNELFWELNI